MNSNPTRLLVGKSTLLISANPFDQALIEGLLEQAEMQTFLADSAESACETLERVQIDFLLADLSILNSDALRFGGRAGGNSKGPIAIGMVGDSATEPSGAIAALIRKPIEPNRFYQTLHRTLSARECRPAGPLPEGFPQTDQLNVQEGLMRLSGNRAAYTKVLKLFATNQREAPKRIREALAAEDLETATRVAHTLKGVAGNVGAMGIHAAALPLEQALSRGELEAAGPLLSELEARLDQLVGTIESWLPGGL